MSPASSPEELLQPLLKYQTWVLKVPINCDGCKRRVKKVLQRIDGVYTTAIDPMQQKVTVIGNVKVELLLKKLLKAGKHAQIWSENDLGKQKNTSKKEQSGNKNDQKSSENVVSDKTSTDSDGGHGSKKRKKKGQICNRPSAGDQTTQATHEDIPSHSRIHFYPYDPTYMASYSMAFPNGIWGTAHHIAYAPYTYGPIQPKVQSGLLDHFQIFSEENLGGCYIM